MEIPILNFIFILTIVPIVTWRLTHLFIEEDGPFDIFLRLRIFASKSKFFKELFTCFLCLSIWIGFFLALVLLPIEFVLLGGFFFSGAAIIVERITE